MQCVVTHVLVCIHSYLKSVLRHKMLFWIRIIRTLYVYVRKYESIRGCFFETERSPQAKNFWETLS